MASVIFILFATLLLNIVVGLITLDVFKKPKFIFYAQAVLFAIMVLTYDFWVDLI